jgi:hypothetical protein
MGILGARFSPKSGFRGALYPTSDTNRCSHHVLGKKDSTCGLVAGARYEPLQMNFKPLNRFVVGRGYFRSVAWRGQSSGLTLEQPESKI